MVSRKFELAVQRITGESIELVRKTPIDEFRRNIETKLGRIIRYKSWFPFVGRGNVLRASAVDHNQAEEALKEALRND